MKQNKIILSLGDEMGEHVDTHPEHGSEENIVVGTHKDGNT